MFRDYYLNNPNVFMYATLVNAATGEDMNHTANGTRTTVGGVVQSLHKLKDIDNTGDMCVKEDDGSKHVLPRY